MFTINGSNVPQAYFEGLRYIRVAGVESDSRNGPVWTVPYPVALQIANPDERVLFDPARNANPFFHLMEAVWMLAGSNDANWLSQFNKRMLEYANDGYLRGAYGWRWRNNGVDQLVGVINQLNHDPSTRQAVLSMWNPLLDHPHSDTLDRPCNTHIYFRVINGFLNMTVCNRSNDFIWGMLGANAVHMTVLHEFVAMATGHALGRYYVFTNNLHVYPELVPNFDEIMNTAGPHDYYTDSTVTPTAEPIPLLQEGEMWQDFLQDCHRLVFGQHDFQTYWFWNVAQPIHDAWIKRKMGGDPINLVNLVKASDWKLACLQWLDRAEARKVTNEKSA